MADLVVVGGGVIGLSIARELAGQGMAVQLLEQGEIGREASWAGAGMLPPGHLAGAQTSEARLRAASHELWPSWSAQLREETGIDNGYLRCGGVTVANLRPRAADGGGTSLGEGANCSSTPEFASARANWQAEGVTVEPLTGAAIRERFPCLAESITEGFFLPDMGQVRNPRHLKALAAACGQRGVELLPGHPVVGIQRHGERIVSVKTPQRIFEAREFVFAGGAWSSQLMQQAGVDFAVEPVRGQMVLLEARPLPFRAVIEQGKRYLVPRPDGKILVGSTEERAGFVKENTAEAIAALIRFGTDLVPLLKSARFDRAWSGLRPHRIGELPYLGRIGGLQNACVAAGHFRSGLQMSPITAVLIRQVVLGQAVALPEECVR
ncbi:MAG: FAD-dependent oxidoreductase [Planctomycetaceae bacterium]